MLARPTVDLKKVHHIYLMGICGTGMASLAGMLKAKGYLVSGSDQNAYPPMSTVLADMGIKIFTPYAANNLSEKPDLVIIGNAVSRDHVEAQVVINQNIPYLSMPECLNQIFLQDKICLVVAGTHGKTTTATLLAWCLEKAGLDPSFFIGGVPKNFSNNFKLGSGKYFVLEGDEYDTAFFDKGPKFLHYNPTHVLLTSVEFDHADIYRDLEHLKTSFKNLVELIPSSGSLIANLDYPVVADVIGMSMAKTKNVFTYGLTKDTSFHIQNLNVKPEGMFFEIAKPQQKASSATMHLNLFGNHNVSNALGVATLLQHLGLSFTQIAEGFATFAGIKRRQEILGTPRNITIIDDFAHHPTAVRETIAAIHCRYPHQKIWAIFEPRSNSSKRDVFQADYPAAFLGADAVVIHDVFMPEKVKDGKVLNVEQIVLDINKIAKKELAQHISGIDHLLNYLTTHAQSGDVLLIMSNGSFGGIHQKLLKDL